MRLWTWPSCDMTLRLDPSEARMLPFRSKAVLHLAAEAVVVRVSSATPTNEARAALVVSLCSWIINHGGPALGPTSHPQPVRVAGTVAALWPYLDSPSKAWALRCDPGRAHPRGAGRELADREQFSGRRQQGHLGAGPHGGGNLVPQLRGAPDVAIPVRCVVVLGRALP